MSKTENRGLIAVIGDEDTVTGFLLAGTGEVDAKQTRNFLVVTPHTTIGALEEFFRETVARPDVAIVLINQFAADKIRWVLDDYSAVLPTILEIPSKESPYDPSKDSVMARVKLLFGSGN